MRIIFIFIYLILLSLDLELNSGFFFIKKRRKCFMGGEEMKLNFANLSGDFNPIHIDKKTAQDKGFKDIVAHIFLGAQISKFLEYLPGKIDISKRLHFIIPFMLKKNQDFGCYF